MPCFILYSKANFACYSRYFLTFAFQSPIMKRTAFLGVGEGNGTQLQYSCLENPMDGGAWKAAVHKVAKSWTRLSDFTFTFHFHALGKENHMDKSLLSRRPLSETYCVRNVLDSYGDTPVCEAVYPDRKSVV